VLTLEKDDVWPYIMILPSSKIELKNIFDSLFKSDIPLRILSLFQDEESIIHQSDIIRAFSQHSNKSIINHLNRLVNAKILKTKIEKIKIQNRSFWVKTYELTKIGNYIKLLFNINVKPEKIRELLKELFYFYVYKIINVSKKYKIDNSELKYLFDKALKESMRDLR
jgi:hypothetical protein